MTDAIKVADSATTAYVRVYGRATFKLANAFRDFVAEELEQGRRGVLVDMQDCVSVDSTFVGLLTSLTLKCRRSGRGCLKMFNVPSAVRGILDTLGLARVLDIVQPQEVDGAAFEQLESGKPDKVQVARLMLDAHETLAGLSEKNAMEFKDVLDHLRAKLQ